MLSSQSHYAPLYAISFAFMPYCGLFDHFTIIIYYRKKYNHFHQNILKSC